MKNNPNLISELLKEKKDIEFQIKETNFKGYPEVKEIAGKKYIYLRFKKYDRLSSKYAGIYTESFYNDLKDISKTIKELNYRLRSINTKLAKLGVNSGKIDSKIILNADFIRNNLNTIIYGQAIVEGVSATFLDTEEILEKGSSRNVSFDDTLTILNLKNAWQYVLDEDTIRLGISFGVLSTIAGYVNDRQVSYPDEIRTTHVKIGGSTYRPEIPSKEKVEDELSKIINNDTLSKLDRAVEIVLFLAKSQVFNNGNKRTSLIFANFYMLLNGIGYLSIPAELDKEYKLLLVDYYEEKNNDVKTFLKKKCFNKLD